jgi:poly(ADP-ribose) glycohydrolase ARH3
MHPFTKVFQIIPFVLCCFQTMKGKSNLEDKFRGCLLASALGDAIGEIAFFRSSRMALQEELRTGNQLRYTDDTAMAIGLAESITRRGSLESRNLGDTFRSNFLREPWRGYASGPPTVFSMVSDLGISYTEAASRLFGGTGSFGNGAAMRIGPVGAFYYDSPRLYEQVRIASAVTHAHPVGIDGAAVLAKAVALAVGLTPSKSLSATKIAVELITFARTDVITEKLNQVNGLISANADPAQAAMTLGQGVAVQESMPFALYSFLHNPHSFKDCLHCAVLNGGDRDTLGAMACAISGAYLGERALPKNWLEKLENVKQIRRLAVKLLQTR